MVTFLHEHCHPVIGSSLNRLICLRLELLLGLSLFVRCLTQPLLSLQFIAYAYMVMRSMVSYTHTSSIVFAKFSIISQSPEVIFRIMITHEHFGRQKGGRIVCLSLRLSQEPSLPPSTFLNSHTRTSHDYLLWIRIRESISLTQPGPTSQIFFWEKISRWANLANICPIWFKFCTVLW